MKKPLLILMCLIGLSAFNQVSAQADLDINNTTSCKFLVYSADLNITTCLTSALTMTTTVPPATSLTVVHTGLPYQVVKVGVTDCAGNSVGLWDLTLCGFGNSLTAILPASACCPSGATLTFTGPTPSTNAILDIN
jgi:hypothetical protein